MRGGVAAVGDLADQAAVVDQAQPDGRLGVPDGVGDQLADHQFGGEDGVLQPPRGQLRGRRPCGRRPTTAGSQGKSQVATWLASSARVRASSRATSSAGRAGSSVVEHGRRRSSARGAAGSGAGRSRRAVSPRRRCRARGPRSVRRCRGRARLPSGSSSSTASKGRPPRPSGGPAGRSRKVDGPVGQPTRRAAGARRGRGCSGGRPGRRPRTGRWRRRPRRSRPRARALAARRLGGQVVDEVVEVSEQFVGGQVDVGQGAHRGTQPAHGGRRVDAVADHVAHDQGDPRAGQRDHIEPVAAHPGAGSRRAGSGRRPRSRRARAASAAAGCAAGSAPCRARGCSGGRCRRRPPPWR